MTPRDFELSIKKAFQVLMDIGVTDWSKFPRKGSLLANTGFNKVALKPACSYEEVYKAALRLNYFNFSLSDHSFFQFSHRKTEDSFSLRLAFYPNPFFIGEEEQELLHEALIDDYDFVDQVFDEASIFIDKPPIRYDYDPSCHTPCEHPAGHLHVGAYPSSRWPVRSILSPEAFCLFVAKQYFHDDWHQFKVEKDAVGGFLNPLDYKYALTASSCEVVADHLFTEQESQHLFLG